MRNRNLKPSRVKSKLKSVSRVYEFEVSQCYFVIFVHFLFSSKANATCSVIANRMISSGTEVGNLWPVGWIPAFTNKALLEHSSVHLLTYCPWLHSCYSGRQSWVTELQERPHCPQMFTISPFTEKCADTCCHQNVTNEMHSIKNTSVTPTENTLAILKTEANYCMINSTVVIMKTPEQPQSPCMT